MQMDGLGVFPSEGEESGGGGGGYVFCMPVDSFFWPFRASFNDAESGGGGTSAGWGGGAVDRVIRGVEEEEVAGKRFCIFFGPFAMSLGDVRSPEGGAHICMSVCGQ